MKKKRLLCWLLICAIVAGLTGCGASSQASSNASADNGTTVASSEVVSNNTDAAVAPEPATTEPEPAQAPDTTPAEPAEPTPIQPIPDSEPAPEPEPELPITPSIAPANFQSGSIEWTNADGYKFLQTFGFSDWIRSDDQELLTATWRSISDAAIPDVSRYITKGYDWYPMEMGTTFNYPCDEIYYCVGYCKTKNLTEGWSITPANAQQVPINLSCETAFSALGVAWSNATIAYHNYKGYVVDAIADIGGNCNLNGKRKEWEKHQTYSSDFDNDRSVPTLYLDTDSEILTPFVIVVGTVRGPKYPDGMPQVADIRVRAGARDSVTSKVQEYTMLPGTTW